MDLRDSFKLLQKQDGCSTRFLQLLQKQNNEYLEIHSTDFKNKTKPVPEIISSYFKKKTDARHLRDSFKLCELLSQIQGIPYVASNYFKNETQRQGMHEILTNYFKNTTKGIPEIFKNYFKNKTQDKRDSFNYFKNMTIDPEILSKYFKNKGYPRFFQTTSKTR